MKRPPVPPFCRRLDPPVEDGRLDLEAARDGQLDGWPVPGGSLLRLGSDGHLLYLKPPRDLELAGVTFRGGSLISFVWRRPYQGMLARDKKIGRVPCLGGREVALGGEPGRWFVQRATLSRDAQVNGYPCAAGTEISRDGGEGGRMFAFVPSRLLVVDGVLCAPGKTIRLQEGRLWVATLAEDRVLSGVPCAGGGPVHFHPDGSLSHAQLSREWRARGGGVWRAGTTVSGRLSQGLVTRGTLARDEVLDGLPCSAGEVQRDARGRPTRFRLARDTVVDRIPCQAGSEVQLDLHGGVFVLAGPYRRFRVTWGRGDRLVIDPYDDYEDAAVTLAAPREIRGHLFPAGSRASIEGWLFPSISVSLGAAATIDGRVIPAGSTVVLGWRGRVKQVLSPPRGAPYR